MHGGWAGTQARAHRDRSTPRGGGGVRACAHCGSSTRGAEAGTGEGRVPNRAGRGSRRTACVAQRILRVGADLPKKEIPGTFETKQPGVQRHLFRCGTCRQVTITSGDYHFLDDYTSGDYHFWMTDYGSALVSRQVTMVVR